MYGLVNRALEQMVIADNNEDVWEQIKQKAGVDVEMFLSNTAYPDEITYALIGAASETLDTPADQLLERFGIHWVLHTATEGYGVMMRSAGKSLAEFMENLPNFHTTVSLVFPELVPPRFELTDSQPGSIQLEYHSSRTGLAPFVVGLLKGLGQRFGTPVTVTQTATRDTHGADHDAFLVQWEERPSA